MKTFLIAALSFITLIGGHFVNRRWDRAVLFLALLFGYGIFCFMVFIPSFANNPEDYFSAYGKMLNVLAGGVILLLIISSVLSVIDKKNPHAITQTKFTLSGKIGASLLSLIASALLFSFVATYVSYTNTISLLNSSGENDGISSSGSSSFYSKRLYSNLKFGNGRYISKPKKLPIGKGFLVGDIAYEGKPAVGVKLKLQLNDEFESDAVLTDEKGRFVLQVPVGEWFVTRIETMNWENKPEGDFLLVSGYEPKISEQGYSKYSMGEAVGLEFKITTIEPVSPHISLNLNSKIKYENAYKNRKPVVYSIKDGKIEWPAYKGARQYQIKISRVKKEGTSTSYYPITFRNVKNSTSMALKDLSSEPVENEGDEKENTYNIDIIAFDEKGDYLSQTDGYQAYSFKIKEPVKLINNIHTGLYGVSSLDVDKRIKFRKRFTAIELLIDEKLYGAATKLLQSEMKGATPGKKDALWGYFYASQKQCKKAKVFFNKANKIGKPGCVISKHEKLCL